MKKQVKRQEREGNKLGKEKVKDNKAITLIALVITIVILLILAGISISALSGDNGLVKQARRSKIGIRKK